MLIKFTKDFDYKVPDTYATVIAYKAGSTVDVEDECAEAAKAAGAAKDFNAPKPKKKEPKDPNADTDEA